VQKNDGRTTERVANQEVLHDRENWCACCTEECIEQDAAQAAEDKIKAVLQWETLPESSTQFKQCAVQIDAEQESKRVRIEDVDDSESDSEVNDTESCIAEDGDDIPNADDKAFIEEDDDYRLQFWRYWLRDFT